MWWVQFFGPRQLGLIQSLLYFSSGANLSYCNVTIIILVIIMQWLSKINCLCCQWESIWGRQHILYGKIQRFGQQQIFSTRESAALFRDWRKHLCILNSDLHTHALSPELFCLEYRQFNKCQQFQILDYLAVSLFIPFEAQYIHFEFLPTDS